MKCPKCQSEMLSSKVGWLCPKCGQVVPLAEKSKPKRAKAVAATSSKRSAAKPLANQNLETLPAPISSQSIAPQTAGLIPVTPHRQSSRKKVLIIILIGIVSVALMVSAYIWAAPRPYKSFQKKITSAKQVGFDGSLKFTAGGFLASFSSNLAFDGHYSASNPSGPAGNLNFNGTWASHQYNGQAVYNGSEAFFKLAGPVLPVIRYNQSSFLYPLTNDWYKTKIDNSLYGNYCETRPDSRYPNGLEMYRLITGLKTRTSPIVNPFGRVNGQSATEYSGTVDSAQMPELLQKINAQLPQGCGLEYYSPPTDPKKLSITYSLLTSQKTDRFKLIFDDKSVDAKIEFTVNLKDYNQPFTIAAPTTAIDLNAVRRSQLDVLNRDHARKNDLDNLKSALDGYATANKQLYPTGLSALSPKFIPVLPSDPRSSQSYGYIVAPARKSFNLTTTLEEPNAGTYSVSGP